MHQEHDMNDGDIANEPAKPTYGEDTDSDADLAPPNCPLCCIDEVLPETACTIAPTNSYMRRIMCQELVHYGMIPDSVIFCNIARCYNRHIQRPLRRAGVECIRWTLPMVREHFERHVCLLPRRVIGRQIRLCQRMLSSLERELDSQLTAAMGSLQEAACLDGFAPNAELVDPKTVKKICDVQTKLVSLLDKYRQFQKEDQVNAGLATLWNSVQLGETETLETSKLLASAAAINTAAGAGDRPKASELFN